MRTLYLTCIAGILAFFIDWAIGAAALRFTHVPPSFPPFTWLPILSGTFGGAILASGVYSLVKVLSKQPQRNFFFVAAVALALSFGLPLRLSFTRSQRFAGVTTAAQMVLILMHTVVAVVSVITLFSGPE